MATAVSVNLNMPKADIGFVRQMAKRMGWSMSIVPRLYDPETGLYFNEETMQAIRDVDAGKTFKCKNLDELLATI